MLTGAAGFIGSYMLGYLNKQDMKTLSSLMISVKKIKSQTTKQKNLLKKLKEEISLTG
jgi:NAD dependent epimerase/dehydratase family enzyme